MGTVAGQTHLHSKEIIVAYMNQERKKALAPSIKEILKKYGIKGTLGVRDYRTLVLNIKSGKIDFISNYNKIAESKPRHDLHPLVKADGNMDVNPYWYHTQFDGKALEFLKELLPAMNKGNHDRSDVQSDYFDVGWYVDVNIGQWDKPYILEK